MTTTSPAPTLTSPSGAWPRPPLSLAEAADRAAEVLTLGDMGALCRTAFANLEQFRYCLGTRIRNHLGLWRPGPGVMSFDRAPVTCPDAASQLVIEALWARFREQAARTRPAPVTGTAGGDFRDMF